MASGVKDLKVWQEAVTLGGDVVRAVRDSTRRETKAFTDWLMLTACTAAAAIAAAHARRSASDERECYLRSRRALLELETGLTIARQAGIITSPVHSQLVSRVGNVSQRLALYLSFVERQVAAEAAAGCAEPLITPPTSVPHTVTFER